MQTEHGEPMQRFQFGRRLALFCQTRMREQRANVMGYSAEQIAIIRSIGFTSELPPQRDKRREPSLSANRETECHPSDRQSIVSGTRSQAPRPLILDQNRVILLQKLHDHRMGKLQWNRFLLSSHRTDLAKPTIGFTKRPDRNRGGGERLDEKIEQTIHDRLSARRLLKGLGDLKPMRAVVVLGSIEVPGEKASDVGAHRF